MVKFSPHKGKTNCGEIQLGSTDVLKLNYRCIQHEELSTNFKHNTKTEKFLILEIYWEDKKKSRASNFIKNKMSIRRKQGVLLLSQGKSI